MKYAITWSVDRFCVFTPEQMPHWARASWGQAIDWQPTVERAWEVWADRETARAETMEQQGRATRNKVVLALAERRAK